MRTLLLLFLGLLPALGAPKLAPGEPFPVVTLPRISDQTLQSTAALKGHKTMLHVFASW